MNAAMLAEPGRVPIPPPRSRGVRGFTQAEIGQLWKDFQRLGSLHATGRLHNRTGGTISSIFADHGLRKRLPSTNPGARRAANGCIIANPRHTRAQITNLVEQRLATLKPWQSFVAIPRELKNEWREWTPAKRKWLIDLLWAKYDEAHPGLAMPAGPCSEGFEPFDYATPRARAIATRANAGLPSRKWTIRLFPASRGLVFRWQLWFWKPKTNRYQLGRFIKGKGRPSLHRRLYEKFHGPIPRGMTVIHRDGNKNNFAPANLALRSMADCARMNQVFKRLREQPHNPDLQRKAAHVTRRLKESIAQWRTRRSRAVLDQVLQINTPKESHADRHLATAVALAQRQRPSVRRARPPMSVRQSRR